ncbi:Pectinesterase inhibitor domain [Macleaya cordata]|uniref:Pectinesterase inhibitor domain n=1 Tax=Macleaya cordata TaxID=56857 RepID=A0A200PW97_MACCD|nr:Pectinesterase inhibitor domain [Macleaya cordata]
MKQIFSFSFLCLFLLHHLIFASASIKETCKKCAEKSPVLNYDFCVTSLQAVPESKTSNAQGLGIISLELAQTNATDTISFIQKLLKYKDFKDTYTKQCLKDCLDLYSDAIPRLVQSIGAFRSNDYVNANIWISALMDAAMTCEDGFDEGRKVSPLKKQNYDFYQLCDIALIITKLVPLRSPLSFLLESKLPQILIYRS